MAGRRQTLFVLDGAALDRDASAVGCPAPREQLADIRTPPSAAYSLMHNTRRISRFG